MVQRIGGEACTFVLKTNVFRKRNPRLVQLRTWAARSWSFTSQSVLCYLISHLRSQPQRPRITLSFHGLGSSHILFCLLTRSLHSLRLIFFFSMWPLTLHHNWTFVPTGHPGPRSGHTCTGPQEPTPVLANTSDVHTISSALVVEEATSEQACWPSGRGGAGGVRTEGMQNQGGRGWASVHQRGDAWGQWASRAGVVKQGSPGSLICEVQACGMGSVQVGLG